MINMTKLSAGIIACAILAGCGGGSTGGNDDTPAFGRADPKIEFFPQKPSLLSNRGGFPIDLQAPYFTQANFKITDDNGFPAPGTTIVDLQISNGNVLSLEQGNPFAIRGCTGTASSIVTYFFAAGAVAGTAQITASVTAPLKSGKIDPVTGICTTEFQTGARDVARQFNYVVNPGPEPFVRLVATAARTTLPVNTFDVAATPGSPFLTSVEVTQKTAFGALVNGGEVSVTVARPDIIQLSLADNPATPTINELATLSSTVKPTLVAGKALFYVHSRQRAGAAVVNIIGTEGGSSFGIDLNISVGSTIAGLSNVVLTSDTRAVYVSNSNANTVLPLQVRATDDAGEGAGDPAAGVNNILLEIVNPNGETLVSTNAAGAGVEGTSIRTRTNASVASGVFRAAARQGLVQIRATADRSDNNVDNGIQAPVFATKGVTVSDGKLFDLTLTSPTIGLIDNTVIVSGFPATQSNGTYSTILSVKGTDRQGNPVLPNTAIEFGLIDSPTIGYPTQGGGQFVNSGGDGDPAEGGFNFSAPSGAFTTAGEGAGPGDTLLLFGGNDGPNRDMESARIIARVNSPTSLDIASTTRFNLNDDTGSSINRGPVIPYAIGRAAIGNVTNTALTNIKGDATTTVNYPVSRIGHVYAVWARGIGDTPSGQTTPELVSDVRVTRFGAALVLKISAAPNTITSGRTSNVQICVEDKFQNPVPSAFIRYGFDKASGTVDGASDGLVRLATGSSGCTIAAVRAFLASATGSTAAADGSIIFSVNGAADVATVKISAATGIALFAIPGRLGGNGGTVTLRLLDAGGDPISGVQIAGSCPTGTAGITAPPGRTNEFGETSATITDDLNRPVTPLKSECVFTALGASATVKLQGVDTCPSGAFSPVVVVPTGCPVAVVPPVVPTTLTVNLQKADGSAYLAAALLPQVQVIGNAGGINCVSTSSLTGSCVGTSIPSGTTVGLTASTGINGVPNAAAFCRWTGAPGCFGTQPTVQVNMTGNLTCVAVFSETGPAGCPTF
jgi:hypothetical protein